VEYVRHTTVEASILTRDHLRPFFLILSVSFFLTDYPVFGQTVFKEYIYKDSGGFCSGTTKFLQITKPLTAINKKINNRIIAFLDDNVGLDSSVISDLNHLPISKDGLGADVKTKLTTQKFNLYSFTISYKVNCWGAAAYPPQIFYLNVDKLTANIITLNELLVENKRTQFEIFVRDYCKSNHVDNVEYQFADQDPDKKEHEQNLIQYRSGLDEPYALTDNSIIVYTQIVDYNAIDYLRRNSKDQTVGLEYMRAEIPLSLAAKYIRRKIR
jgi:hypothetical protein